MPTINATYNNGSSSNDQTAHIAPSKGGAVVFKAATAAVGSLVRALTSVGGVLFDVVDAAIPMVKLAGAFVQDDPVFGSPVMGSQKKGDFMSYSADGVGSSWGGTGLTAKSADPPSNFGAFMVFSLNDNKFLAATFNTDGNKVAISPENSEFGDGKPYVGLGCGAASDLQRIPFLRVWSQLYGVLVGAPLASAATIAPDSGIHHVTGTTPIDTVTPPCSDFQGALTLIMDDNCNLATGGNIDPAAVEQANLRATEAAAVSGNAKVVLTYDGSTWY